ncbi:nucleotide sugar dehydrogenase [Streptomyces spinosirectus]|uniref:nucleotide sugar dehydrogenase n=1 Tax=Streptomyces TaxID=1883 RepID=UPI001C9D9926|nr:MULTISPECIES: nucleotide sugar dehydrogenase [Streptomyces]MBY8341969.1 nucleotide sugar dehydrogenase [Streptomyces plumbidurans]UIR16682.1 nucleotide sugar dehydrogenase [Streptomyces spinosirectus]
MKIAVMGQGYVGLPLAMAAVEAGHRVTGFEPDPDRCAQLQAGTSYVEDVPDERLAAALATGRYLPTGDDIHLTGFDTAVITVPTPLKDRQPDLSFIESAARTLADSVDDGALVVLESTTHPGTTRDVVGRIIEQRSGARPGADFHLAFSPERIDPGNQQWRFENTPKIVAGLTKECLRRACEFYTSVTSDVVPAQSLEAAELAKVFENTFRHVNIALVNELGHLARTLGVDVWHTLDLAASKPFGFTKFLPGPGVGGHCLPVDPVYLTHHARTQHRHAMRLVELAQDINEAQPAYTVTRLQDALNARRTLLNGARILALGLAYKPGTADLRESPAVEVVELLGAKGAAVDIVEPHLPKLTPRDFRAIPEDLSVYDAVVLLTPHDTFDLQHVADHAQFVLDTRGVMPDAPHIERL